MYVKRWKINTCMCIHNMFSLKQRNDDCNDKKSIIEILRKNVKAHFICVNRHLIPYIAFWNNYDKKRREKTEKQCRYYSVWNKCTVCPLDNKWQFYTWTILFKLCYWHGMARLLIRYHYSPVVWCSRGSNHVPGNPARWTGPSFGII